jgi:cell division cycle 14
LKGLERAISLGWYNFNKFDYKQYEFNHKLENGDMNWIIPNKILALSSPTERRSEGLPASFFIDKFESMSIKAIIRLNESLYDEREFRKVGISVYDHEFLDGSCPSDVRLTHLIYHF